jgi:hypothetical protein
MAVVDDPQSPAPAELDLVLIGSIVGGVAGLLCIIGAIVAVVLVGRRRAAHSPKSPETQAGTISSMTSSYDKIPVPSSYYDEPSVVRQM